MEHSFIGISAEFYGLSYKNHMEMLYPTNQTLILLSVLVVKVGVKFSKRKTQYGKISSVCHLLNLHGKC